MNITEIPSHVAIIMDGNRRWAKEKNLPTSIGHKKGADAVKKLIKESVKIGINYLTLYAFSSENWQRSSNEIDDLMNLLRFYLQVEINNLKKQDIKLNIIGSRNLLAKDIQERIIKAEELTKDNKGLNLNIAINYGSRQEIIEATKKIFNDISQEKISINEISEEVFNRYLYTANIPYPDLLIRTGGEERISNFLLWQIAYTELFFCKTLWPDFSKEDFNKAIESYQLRERRYGKN